MHVDYAKNHTWIMRILRMRERIITILYYRSVCAINSWKIVIHRLRRQGEYCTCAHRAFAFPQVVEEFSAQSKKFANRLKNLNSVVESVQVDLHLFTTQFHPHAMAAAVLFAVRRNHGCINPSRRVTRGRSVQNH